MVSFFIIENICKICYNKKVIDKKRSIYERFDRLKKLAESQIAGNNQKYVNTIQKVLVEGKSKTNENMLTGRTDTNKVVNFEGTEDMIGKIVNLKIVSEHMWYLKGKEEK